MKSVTLENYKNDTYYPKVVVAMERILAKGNLATPIDVFVAIGMLEHAKLKEWKCGHVAYLEKVINGNLSKSTLRLRSVRRCSTV